MIGFYEVLDRALSGRYCTETEFEMEILVPKVSEVVSKYGIKYDPDNPVPSDDDLADRVFQAGLELYRDVGTYCPNTERVMQFSEEEIQKALTDAPSTSVYGEGKEAKILRPRKPESDIPPFCFVGAVGAAVSNEELYASILEAYAAFLPLADAITAPSIATINGRTVRAGSPSEVLASIRATVMAREALRRGGRPGLPLMNCIASAGSDTAKIAGSHFGLRPSDGWVVCHSAELKLEYQRLNEIAFVTTLGGHINATMAPMLGGYCGGPEGTAVVNVAYLVSCIMVMRGSCSLTFPMNFKYGCTTARDATWARSVSGQAMSRNSHFPFLFVNYNTAGPMTEMVFHEMAAEITSSVASGGSIEAPGVAKCTRMNHFTPMEPRMATEIAHAVTGMTRKEANQVVKKLLDKYERHIPDPPVGKKYAECWDINQKAPSPEYVDLYKKVKEELRDVGIPL